MPTRVIEQVDSHDPTKTSYVVERSPDSSFTNVTSTKLPANATSYADTAVTTSTTYWYRVKAINSTGRSDYSASVSVTTRPPPPAAPTNLVATVPSPSSTRLDWTDNAGDETGFVVERSPDSLFVSPTVINLPSNATTYTDSGLAEEVLADGEVVHLLVVEVRAADGRGEDRRVGGDPGDAVLVDQ